MKNTHDSLRERTLKLLEGKALGRYDKLIQDSSNTFACVFLRYVEILGNTIKPIDESRLSGEDDLTYLQESQDVIAEKVELPEDWYREDYGSFICNDSNGKPVIMQKTTFGYSAFDVIENTKVRITSKNASSYSKEAIKGIPLYTDKDISFTKILRKVMKGGMADRLILIILSLLVSILGMVAPIIIGSLAGNITTSEGVETFPAIGISILFAIVTMILFSIVVNRIKARIVSKTRFGVFSNMIHHIMQMVPSEVDSIANKIIANLFPCLNAVESFVGSFYTAVLYALQCIALVFVLSRYLGMSSSTVVSFVILEILLSLLIQVLNYKVEKKIIEKNTEFTTLRKEMLDSIEAIKANNIETKMFYRYAVSFNEYTAYRIKKQDLQQWFSIIGSMLSGIGTLAVFITVSFNPSSFTVGSVTTMMTIFSLLIGYLNPFTASITELLRNIPGIKFINEIFSKPVELVGNNGKKVNVKGKIEMSHVMFSYKDSDKPVIRDISLTINPGEYVGIVGSSGCGKSTLIRLLLGFEKPDSGEIYIDDTSLKECDMRYLRSKFGVVLQNAGIIAGTIKMNIGMSNNPDMEKVEEVSKIAEIYNDIMDMPMKYNTFVSDESPTISGGQKQRIVLARALMNNPRILILDEATSAMDNISQKCVKENLDKMGITRVVIAHRLSTIRNCDKIIVMDSGRIAEVGTYDELMSKNGLFAKLEGNQTLLTDPNS